MVDECCSCALVRGVAPEIQVVLILGTMVVLTSWGKPGLPGLDPFPVSAKIVVRFSREERHIKND